MIVILLVEMYCFKCFGVNLNKNYSKKFKSRVIKI